MIVNFEGYNIEFMRLLGYGVMLYPIGITL